MGAGDVDFEVKCQSWKSPHAPLSVTQTGVVRWIEETAEISGLT
jgi:hypothetical protein